MSEAFGWREVPTSVLKASSQLPFISTDERDALWFQSRDWRDLTWEQWNEYFRGLFFFTTEALAYYLPSIILLSMKPLNERMLATDSVLMRLQEGITCSVDNGVPTTDYLRLTRKESAVLSAWLECLGSLSGYDVGPNRLRIDAVLALLESGGALPTGPL